MNRCYLFILIMLFSFSVMGQNRQTRENNVPWIFNMNESGKYMDITAGSAPKSPYSAIKSSFSINNLILQRIGFYTSIEKGLTTDADIFHDYDNHAYFTHLLGMTASLNQNVYFWGGIDFFTKSGVFYTHGKTRGPRKEIGIGITPYEWTVVRLGWSKTVGPSFTIGAKIPL